MHFAGARQRSQNQQIQRSRRNFVPMQSITSAIVRLCHCQTVSHACYDGEILLDATEAIEELLTGLASLLQLIDSKTEWAAHDPPMHTAWWNRGSRTKLEGRN